MKLLNNVSRSQAIFRHTRIKADDLFSGHYAYVLLISSHPGRSQEELAKELCINKSTVARNLACLEERGYITRTPIASDKRRFSVYPTEKMLSVLPEVRSASDEWMRLLSEGISEEELGVFNSVLERMEKRAREITELGENLK